MSSFEKEIEKSVTRGVEKGVERGIVNAVEELICKGLIEQITQRAVNVIALDAVAAIEIGMGMEKILKNVLKNDAEQIQNTILNILKKKHGDVDETQINNLLENMVGVKDLNTLTQKAIESESVETFCKCVEDLNSPNK